MTLLHSSCNSIKKRIHTGLNINIVGFLHLHVYYCIITSAKLVVWIDLLVFFRNASSRNMQNVVYGLLLFICLVYFWKGQPQLWQHVIRLWDQPHSVVIIFSTLPNDINEGDIFVVSSLIFHNIGVIIHFSALAEVSRMLLLLKLLQYTVQWKIPLYKNLISNCIC